MNWNNVYRWCDDFGGGLVMATSANEAEVKIRAYMSDVGQADERTKFTIWSLLNDDYYNEKHPDVLDIY